MVPWIDSSVLVFISDLRYSFISCYTTRFVFTCWPPKGLYAVTTCPMNMDVGTMTAPHAIGAVTSLVTSCCPAGNLERVKRRKGKRNRRNKYLIYHISYLVSYKGYYSDVPKQLGFIQRFCSLRSSISPFISLGCLPTGSVGPGWTWPRRCLAVCCSAAGWCWSATR